MSLAYSSSLCGDYDMVMTITKVMEIQTLNVIKVHTLKILRLFFRDLKKDYDSDSEMLILFGWEKMSTKNLIHSDMVKFCYILDSVIVLYTH